MLLAPLLLLGLSNLSASETKPVFSGYISDSSHSCQATDNTPQSLERFKHNTQFLSPENSSEGICLGLACAWLQAVVEQIDTHLLLSQRLQTCSRDSVQGWQHHNHSYDSLEQIVRFAQERYDAYRTANGMPDTPSTLKHFAGQDVESAELLATSTWVQWLYREQQRQQGCSSEVTTSHETSPPLAMTQAWPMAADRKTITRLLRDIQRLPIPGHYLVTTEQHVLALSIEDDRIILFDQNNPCYFQVVDRASSDDLAPVLFNALLPPLDCDISISDAYAEVQCGRFRSRLPSDPDKPWNIKNHSFLKAVQAYAVFTIQAVLPTNSSRKAVAGIDEQLEWLSDQQFNRVPNVNIADARGVTRLHLASRAGNQVSVAEQLRAKAWHSPVTEAGQTPLSLAKARGQQEVVKLLQAEGAIETAGPPDSEPSTLLYQRYSQPQVHPEPQIYQPDYRHPATERLPGQSFGQHCQAGCGTGVGDSGSPDGYRFRKAIAAIGRGEDPVSQGVERTVQGMVKISYEHFPEETQKILNGLAASGEAVDAVIDFADRTTGRVVSKKWNSLDQVTRDELAGYGKIFSVIVPATKVRGLLQTGKNLESTVLSSTRVGSANKIPDGQHGFNDIIDNYSTIAKTFKIPTKGPGGQVTRYSELMQVEGSNNGISGVFEWIVDQEKVTHRRFIPGGKVTGHPNQIPKKQGGE